MTIPLYRDLRVRMIVYFVLIIVTGSYDCAISTTDGCVMRASCKKRTAAEGKHVQFNLFLKESYRGIWINGKCLSLIYRPREKLTMLLPTIKNLGCKTMHDYGTDYVNKEYILMIVSII